MTKAKHENFIVRSSVEISMNLGSCQNRKTKEQKDMIRISLWNQSAKKTHADGRWIR